MTNLDDKRHCLNRHAHLIEDWKVIYGSITPEA